MNNIDIKQYVLPLLAAALVLGMTMNLQACGDCSHGNNHHTMHPPATPQVRDGDSYPLATDPVTDDELDESPGIVRHEQREFSLANQTNADQFESQPNRYIPELNQQMVQVLPALATNDTAVVTNAWCPVTPKKPSVAQFWIDHDGQRVFFCCERCRTQFQRDPGHYLTVLASITVQAQTIPRSKPDLHDDHDHHHGWMPALLGWLGKFHPMAVHFPVALLIAAAIAELLRFIFSLAWLRDAARFCIWAGTVGAVFAAPLGWFNAGWDIAHDNWILATHRWLGTLVLLWSLALVILLEKARRHSTAGWQRCYFVALMLGAVLVGTVGHFGGMLVFGSDYYQW